MSHLMKRNKDPAQMRHSKQTRLSILRGNEMINIEQLGLLTQQIKLIHAVYAVQDRFIVFPS